MVGNCEFGSSLDPSLFLTSSLGGKSKHLQKWQMGKSLRFQREKWGKMPWNDWKIFDLTKNSRVLTQLNCFSMFWEIQYFSKLTHTACPLCQGAGGCTTCFNVEMFQSFPCKSWHFEHFRRNLWILINTSNCQNKNFTPNLRWWNYLNILTSQRRFSILPCHEHKYWFHIF